MKHLTTKSIVSKLKLIARTVWTVMYAENDYRLLAISKDDYEKTFINGRTNAEIEKTYNIAWGARNIVIDNYWKRANYYWAFQIASFTGYFAVSGSVVHSRNEVLYFVICIGCITSIAWLLTNRGSRASQRHWEIHVDMLEDYVTGPLNKIRTKAETLSITKINEIVSGFIFSIWLVLAIKYLSENITIYFNKKTEIDWEIWFCSLGTTYCIIAMRFGYGRKRFNNAKWQFYKREHPQD